MVFHSVRVTPSDLDLNINGINIDKTRTFKFLWLTLNDILSWGDLQLSLEKYHVVME